MDAYLVEKEIKRIEQYLFDRGNWQDIELTREWAKSQPTIAGVYMLFENGNAVYIGETKNISGRIINLLNTRTHTARRAIGETYFNTVPGYKKATTKCKFPDHIEKLVNEKLTNFKLSVLTINFGRKEFEEYTIKKHNPKLNSNSKNSKINA